MGNRQLFDEKSALELLEEFKTSGSNEPFEEIVRRYAAMVFGVCLRITGDKHDAEDATQAVFLSLALQAKTSRQITYVGPWLQKVAHRLALDTKKSKTRRKRREEKLADQQRHESGNGRISVNGGAFGGGNGHMLNPADKPATEELKTIMMEELNQLPAKYRMPLVMHYFGGLSREEMSEQLGCNPSTLGVRVHRGKAMLGTRLAKRGIAISAVVMGVLLECVVRESATAPIIGTATASSSGLIAGHGMGTMIASAKVIQIVRSTARALVYAKMRYAVVAVLVISSAAFATGSGVVRQIKAHLPSINLTGWIKPFFRSMLPDLRADSGEQDGLAPLSDSGVVSAKPNPKVSFNPEIYGQSPLVIQPAPERVSLPSASRTIAANRPAQQPTSSNNDAPIGGLAQAILSPQLYSNGARKPANSAGSDLALGEQSAKSQSADVQETIAASASSFTLGAGGGGGSGKADVYVMPASASMRTSSMTIGAAPGSVALFRQLGGVNRIDGSLVLGRQQGAVGTYELQGGTLFAKNEIIGDSGDGAFIQTSGVNVASNSIIVGNSGTGSYELDGGSVTVDYKPVVATATAQSDGGLLVAVKPGSVGTFFFSSGTLSADPQQVGVGGTGTVVQSGGQNTTGSVQLATTPGSAGDYYLSNGSLTFVPRGNPTSIADAAISVGGKGHGKFVFGGDTTTGTINQTGGYGASVVVRGTPTAEGSIRGWGKINLNGVLVNNGQIIADGSRHDRTLDLSSFSAVATTIENPRWGGTNGWFARRRGELKLPAIPVEAGTHTYTWGEDAGDPMLDLVNSVRFKMIDAENEGDVAIALLSAIRTDIPKLPEGHHFIGVWSFDASEIHGFDGVDLQVRYDDAAAAAMGLDENVLKLWRYEPGDSMWHRIMDQTFSRDTIDHLISGRAPENFTYFAVSAPEPSSAVLMLVGATALLRRRRRARSN